MRKINKFILGLFLIGIVSNSGSALIAQDLDSANLRLISPSIGSPLAGNVDSANYSQLYDATVGSFSTTSATYEAKGGFQTFQEPAIPEVSCFEAFVNSGSLCTGIPGSDGTEPICTNLGCYDRAKIEIDTNTNADDTRYAIQISTSPTFASNVFYVDGVTRFLKSTLTLNDFIPKCEWEGTIVSGICASANATWQRHNILNLEPGTTYYVRLSAQKGTATYAEFTQTDWSPTVNATTQQPQITIDIDIAPNTSTSTTPPYIVNLGTLNTGIVTTATNLIITRVTSNSVNGVVMQVRGLNGGLKDSGSNQINSVNADLDSVSIGYGLRNSSTTNASTYGAFIGTINTASTPSDFTDTGAAQKVGQVPVTYVPLYTSNNLPLHTGIAGFLVKAKTNTSLPTGAYQETITYNVYGTF